LEPVRAQRREHEVQQAAEDAVLVERLDAVDRRGDLVDEPVGVLLAIEPGIEPGDEALDEPARDVGVRGQRVLDVRLAVERAELAQVPAVGA
jgi:hypothetical protein